MNRFLLESHCIEFPAEGEEIIIIYDNKSFEKAIYKKNQFFDKYTEIPFSTPKWWVRIVSLDK